jgi:hypothetical protein
VLDAGERILMRDGYKLDQHRRSTTLDRPASAFDHVHVGALGIDLDEADILESIFVQRRHADWNFDIRAEIAVRLRDAGVEMNVDPLLDLRNIQGRETAAVRQRDFVYRNCRSELLAGETREKRMRFESRHAACNPRKCVAVVAPVRPDVDGWTPDRDDVRKDAQFRLAVARELGELVRIVEPGRNKVLEPIVDRQTHDAPFHHPGNGAPRAFIPLGPRATQWLSSAE